jgi:hypothetical protein
MKQTLEGLEEFDIGLDELRSLGGGESRVTDQYTGTKALMLAVLEDGIDSYFHGRGRAREEAEYWVTTPRRHSPFSFAVVCETLGLDPQAVREALHRMRETQNIPRHPVRRARPQARRQRLSW